MKIIHLKRRTLLAYVLLFSSGCLVLWIFLFLSSNQSVQSHGSIDQTALDSVAKPQEPAKLFGVKDFASSNNQKTEVAQPIVIPDNAALRNMSWSALAELYHSYLSQIQLQCKDIPRIGRITDGGWNICADPGFVPKEPCLVYSFGVGDDFSFEDSIIRNYGCHVYSFDPDMNMLSQQRSEKSVFYRQGVADSDRTLTNGWVMSKFETLRGTLKHTKRNISIVKMDIEEWEWEVLPDLLASDHLATVGQLLLELHQCEGCSKYLPQQDDKEPNRDHYIHMLELLSGLYKKGFRIFHTHQNRACRYVSKFTLSERSACFEIGLAQKIT
ncbi:methyltransferase-like protein 24 [Plakobranchus ocellatus]|uniref:Methyltransferase-like protein 24 n=1 Tax=Plakobranchus ocellatus TaxID=259542 RepID=A0AAV3YT99_9GAST|nr:methyltransferase-like protein 24 [Plakobranchus ocellatus]